MGGEHIGQPEGGDGALAYPSSDAAAFDHVEVLIGLGTLTAGDGPQDVSVGMFAASSFDCLQCRDDRAKCFHNVPRALDARLLRKPGTSRGCECCRYPVSRMGGYFRATWAS